MSKIVFSKEERAILVEKLQGYFREEMDQDLGRFPAEFLLDFLIEEMAPYFYNRGLYDARAVLMKQIDAITDGIYEIEKPTDFTPQ
ncbi:DUF2164 domain-containing protein [Cohaesibacter gelatinilyticus]|uniref:Uncharacterized conserved protein, DUF2164 family n=1 Tax=Cohaesibacter gelatinilyticus TaxID=372072 RepID=A0A285PLV5_9HYPH|nr:DUF2164 domain-containing protein [Cohaesibacter gelatinilyticus]SNZ20851.1 Uncharacterized conserved protein, DUF2164 family [Cohaesibacter gelatinilyticus]